MFDKACLVPNLHHSEEALGSSVENTDISTTRPFDDGLWVEHGLKIRLLSDCCCCLSLQVLLAIATCPNQDPAELARYDSCILGEANAQIASSFIFFLFYQLANVSSSGFCTGCSAELQRGSLSPANVFCNCQRELPQTHTHIHTLTRQHTHTLHVMLIVSNANFLFFFR